MPQLPSLNISDQTVWNRLMTAFNNNPNEFKAWLKSVIIAELEAREARVIQQDASERIRAKGQELQGFLDSAT